MGVRGNRISKTIIVTLIRVVVGVAVGMPVESVSTLESWSVFWSSAAAAAATDEDNDLNQDYLYNGDCYRLVALL